MEHADTVNRLHKCCKHKDRRPPTVHTGTGTVVSLFSIQFRFFHQDKAEEFSIGPAFNMVTGDKVVLKRYTTARGLVRRTHTCVGDSPGVPKKFTRKLIRERTKRACLSNSVERSANDPRRAMSYDEATEVKLNMINVNMGMQPPTATLSSDALNALSHTGRKNAQEPESEGNLLCALWQ
ncbi:hypothetical protein EVAR_28907_1 [Eumeta japonica]|uniref:Uncharacterized protein n=1 Tax=Eumeta variegata TaxID=151549 RepID=A0A4C1X1X6_EUMVA|nr:hypothetical protein EVAR_28907_1 [Eumeta japonica]